MWRNSGNYRSARPDKLAIREISAVELTRAHLDRIDAVEGRVRSFVTVTDQDALREAERIDRMRREGETLAHWPGYRWH